MKQVKITSGIDDEEVGTISSDGQKLTWFPDVPELKLIATRSMVGREAVGLVDPADDPDGFLEELQYIYRSAALRASAPV